MVDLNTITEMVVLLRRDYLDKDCVYKTTREKYKAVIDEIVIGK